MQVIDGVVVGGHGAIIFHDLLWRSARHALIGGIAQGIKPCRRVAQRKEIHARADIVQQLAVTQAHRIASVVFIVSQLTPCVGQVDRVCAKAAEVLPDTQGQTGVPIGQLRSAVKGEAVSPAVEQLALSERRRVLIACWTVFTGSEGIFHLPVTHQIRHAGKGQCVLRLAAIAFLNGDCQIATGRGRIEIFQHKRSWRNGGLINDVAVLANRYGGIAAGDTANFRGVTAQAGRQHIVIGFQGDAAQPNGIKNLCRGVRFPCIKLGAQG